MNWRLYWQHCSWCKKQSEGRGFESHRGSQGSNYFPYAQTQEKNKELGNSVTENEEGSIPSLARNAGLGAQRRSYSDWIKILFADNVLEYQSGVKAKRQLGLLRPLSQAVKDAALSRRRREFDSPRGHQWRIIRTLLSFLRQYLDKQKTPNRLISARCFS